MSMQHVQQLNPCLKQVAPSEYKSHDAKDEEWFGVLSPISMLACALACEGRSLCTISHTARCLVALIWLITLEY
jgi:hypothetical protein